MIYKLDKTEYEKVRPLFQAFEYHLTSAAVLDGNNPGKVFVDNSARPQSAFMFSPEGCYLAGNSGHDAFNRALNEALHGKQLLGEPMEALCFVCASTSWEKQLAVVLHPHQPIQIPRRHYSCRKLKYDWRVNLPDGFAVYRVDEALLNRPELEIPRHIKGWIENNWGATADFLQRGFGFVTLHKDADDAVRVVSWSLADCRSGDACEIGIHAVKEYRRRGLATITAAAAVEYALSNGYSMVGWQCSEDNLGSIGTAEKVGFERERDYTLWYAALKQEA
jgi:RimJ/RimL family protein N-acetyltransferase